MTKIVSIILAFITMTMASAGSESIYTVTDVQGKVLYEAKPGLWKNVCPEQVLQPSTVVDVGLNSVLEFSDDKNSYTIKSGKKGSIETLISKNASKKGIHLGNMNTSAIPGQRTSEKGIGTAASRAERSDDFYWEE